MNARGRPLADVAHDLRTPLNAISTWIQVLENHLGAAGPDVRRALEGIRAGVQQQVGLIEELLEGDAEENASGDAVNEKTTRRGER